MHTRIASVANTGIALNVGAISVRCYGKTCIFERPWRGAIWAEQSLAVTNARLTHQKMPVSDPNHTSLMVKHFVPIRTE